MESRKVRYTKRVLREGVIELLETRRLSDITVKDLCEAADLNRSTFYAHYQGIHELFSEMEDEMADDMPVMFDDADVREGIRNLVRYFKRNDTLCRAFVMEGSLVQKLNARSLDLWVARSPRTPKQRDAFFFLSTVFTSGLFDALVDWVGGESHLSEAEVTDMLCRIFESLRETRRMWEAYPQTGRPPERDLSQTGSV